MSVYTYMCVCLCVWNICYFFIIELSAQYCDHFFCFVIFCVNNTWNIHFSPCLQHCLYTAVLSRSLFYFKVIHIFASQEKYNYNNISSLLPSERSTLVKTIRIYCASAACLLRCFGACHLLLKRMSYNGRFTQLRKPTSIDRLYITHRATSQMPRPA